MSSIPPPSAPKRSYRRSAADLAVRSGRASEERERFALALRKHGGNVMSAWREELPEYPERTFKRWIKTFGLQPLVAEERRKARAKKLGSRADVLARGAGTSPNGNSLRPSAPSRPNG